MKRKVVIIGGGLSGTLMAVALSEIANGPEIILIEKNPEMLGRGVAYHHDFSHQPLNVVASAMSLFTDKPLHFLDWLHANHFRYRHLLPDVFPKAFVPRKIFGDYVVENLEQIHLKAPGRFQIRIDEAVSICDSGNSLQVSLDSGVKLIADDVVLALGNFPPADLFDENDSLSKDPRYFSNPWTDKIYTNIKGDENILLVGTGLTAVDVLLGLKVRDFKGTITMISRRGKLPNPHVLSHTPVKIQYPGHLHPRDAFFWLKKIINSNKQIPLPSVIDGLRPITQNFWRDWTKNEKKYFLKRLRPFWEIARHRIPTSSSFILTEMVNSGRLKIGKGAILNTSLSDSGITVQYSFENLEKKEIFHKLINCTGPESNYRKVKFPIIRNLIEQGKVVSDELGLGICSDSEGRIMNAAVKVENGLWCIGPMRKAALWETTALREIREQAAELSRLIAG